MRLHFFYHRIRQNNVNPWIKITSTLDIRYSIFPSSKQPGNHTAVVTYSLARYVSAVGGEEPGGQ